MTTYEKVKACYDEVIYNTKYAASFDSRMVPVVQREYGFIAYRDAYIALRANTFLTGRKGVCNDYSCAFVALTRAIGLKSYIVTGKTNTVSGGYAGHMWVNILINGVYYTFDPQVECNIMLRREDKQIIYSRFCATDEEMKGKLKLDDREYDVSLFNDFKKVGEEDVTYPTILPTGVGTDYTGVETTAASGLTSTTEYGSGIISPVFTEDLGIVSVSSQGKMRLGKDIVFTVTERPADEVLITVIDGIGKYADMSYIRYPECRYDTEENLIIWTPEETGPYTVICYCCDENGDFVQASHYEYEFYEECTVYTEDGLMTVSPYNTPVLKIIPFLADDGAIFTDASGNELSPYSVLKTGCRCISDEKEYAVYIKGDTDGNGKIDSTDYILIKRNILGISVLQNEYFKAADADGNNKLDSTDYIIVKRHILGLSDLRADFLPPFVPGVTEPSVVTGTTETAASSETSGTPGTTEATEVTVTSTSDPVTCTTCISEPSDIG